MFRKILYIFKNLWSGVQLGYYRCFNSDTGLEECQEDCIANGVQGEFQKISFKLFIYNEYSTKFACFLWKAWVCGKWEANFLFENNQSELFDIVTKILVILKFLPVPHSGELMTLFIVNLLLTVELSLLGFISTVGLIPATILEIMEMTWTCHRFINSTKLGFTASGKVRSKNQNLNLQFFFEHLLYHIFEIQTQMWTRFHTFLKDYVEPQILNELEYWPLYRMVTNACYWCC